MNLNNYKYLEYRDKNSIYRSINNFTYLALKEGHYYYHERYINIKINSLS